MEMEKDITVERAVELLRAAVRPVGTERVPAREAHGRVPAENVYAPIDQPPWPRSPLDGYALRASDSAGAPVTLRVADTVYAGGVPSVSVGSGECVRIMTGAMIPDGCDCVIRQEDTDGGTERVTLFKSLRPWDNYCFAGEDFKAGAVLVPAGTVLNAAAMGVLASAGMLRPGETLTVRRHVRCALICTGDELAPNETRPLPPGKIYSSNAALLASRLRELGIGLTGVQAAFGDDAAALAHEIRAAAREADLVLTTGGVSVGTKDILHETLPLLGAERVFWRVELKPGSPVMFSLLDGVPVLSLSGNPFAAWATFELFARPLLAALAGTDALLPLKCLGTLEMPFPKGGRARRFVRGVFRDGRVALPEGHSSGQLASAVGTNCLAEIPANAGPLPAGSAVRVWLL
ncbi:MAG: molybdopterin molybdotransferase MoeA [Oscillospiraceae bacterium]|nr:molybdopterin molybdotransferase MoeA [Oscillospiraceae bacterium]